MKTTLELSSSKLQVYDNDFSKHHHQGCVDLNNKLIFVYIFATHVVTPLSLQCDVIDSSRGTLMSHCDII